MTRKTGRSGLIEKFAESGGMVLLLGSPLGSVTMLHYSESVVNVLDKNIARYKVPLTVNGAMRWIAIEVFDTASGIVDWGDEDY